MKATYLGGNSVRLTPSLLWYIMKPTMELSKLMKATRDNLPNVRTPLVSVYSTADELVSFRSFDILKSGSTGAPHEHIILADSLHAYFPEHESVIIEQALDKMIF
jgi:esterase/lipase